MENTLERNPICSAMAGIMSVHYADIADVVSVKPNGGGVTVVLAPGKSWLEIETEAASMNVVPEEGGAYRHKADIVYHGNQNNVQRSLLEMTLRRYLLKITDNNGTEWLLGCMESALRMEYESTNDGVPDGTTAYTLHFTALCPMPEMRIC